MKGRRYLPCLMKSDTYQRADKILVFKGQSQEKQKFLTD